MVTSQMEHRENNLKFCYTLLEQISGLILKHFCIINYSVSKRLAQMLSFNHFLLTSDIWGEGVGTENLSTQPTYQMINQNFFLVYLRRNS